MASRIEPPLGSQVAAPQHFVPPSARELRAQSIHRLQVGLFGLAVVLLVVALANIIMDRARPAEGPAEVAPMDVKDPPTKAASDPLADIGVVPKAAPTPAAKAGPPAETVDPL